MRAEKVRRQSVKCRSRLNNIGLEVSEQLEFGMNDEVEVSVMARIKKY